ncbi:MAG: hypothetical protein RBR71_13495 [Gudongella sp.]|nr:hypothetical protein [Gudongella sp.]
MSKENRKLIQYLGIIFIAVLLTYKLPHDSYSIIQYIIPPIKINNGAIYLSGIVLLILFIIGIKGLFKLERFADKSKLLIVITVILIIIPLIRWTLDFSRTNYHWIKGDGLEAIDIKESNIRLSSTDDKMTIIISLELKDYGRKQNKFKIRVYLPESLKVYTGKEYYDLESYYYTHGGRNISKIQESIIIKLSNNYEEIQLFDSKWHWEDLEFELYNNEENIKIVQHGL